MERKDKNTTARKNGNALESASIEMGNKPPQALEVERAVLGAMLIEPECVSEVVEQLKPNSFYAPKHRLIFEAILELNNERCAVDILTVSERLKHNGCNEVVGGSAYLAELSQMVGSAVHLEYHMRILQQKSIQRDLIEASFGILKDSFSETVDVEDLVESSQSRIFDAVQGNRRSEYKHIGDVVNNSLERMQAIQSGDSVLGIKSGFPSLDSITMGWQQSNLVIIGARPSVGKTAFALNMARNAAVDFNIPTAFFSLEMTDVELADRLICSEAAISSDKIRGRRMKQSDWTRLEKAIAKLVKAPLYIDETPGITITEFNAKAKRLVREKDVKLIFVDYLQLMHSSTHQTQYREQEVSAVSQALKATAKELHIPIIALSQLNRNLMSRQAGNGRPVLSDLRDSGAIEQDADMVLLLHRPGMLGLEEDLKKTELIVAKNRNGRIGDIELVYEGDIVKFYDLKSPDMEMASWPSRMNCPDMD